MRRGDRKYYAKLTALTCPDLDRLWTDPDATFVVYCYSSRYPDLGHLMAAMPTEAGLHTGFADYELSVRQPSVVHKTASRIVMQTEGPELHEYFRKLNGLAPRRYPGGDGSIFDPPLGRLIMATDGNIVDYDFNRIDLDDPLMELTWCLNEAAQRHLGFAHPTEWGMTESKRHLLATFGIDRIPDQGLTALAGRVTPPQWARYCVEYWHQQPKAWSAWIIDAMLRSLLQYPDTEDTAPLREALILAQTDLDACRILDKYLGATQLERGYRTVLDIMIDAVDLDTVQATLASARNRGT